MAQYALFTDVSINPQLKTGIGGCLVLPLEALDNKPELIDRHEIAGRIIFEKFENTSSTKLEIETAIWALRRFAGTVEAPHNRLVLFTDSQCIAGLPTRRSKLESAGFTGRNSGRDLNHAALYKQFYGLMDQYGFEIVKVTGHVRSSAHDTIHRIFSIVDRGVRKELKLLMKGG